MKKILLLVIWVIFCIPNLTAQNRNKKSLKQPAEKAKKINWSVNPFEHALFVENKGQFDNVPAEGKILFEAKLGAVNAFFTSKGVLYKCMKTEKLDFAKGKDPDQSGPPKRSYYYVNTEWTGANPGVSINASEEQAYYYTYPKGNDNSYIVNVFEKITYTNLYPGIDVVYSFSGVNNNLEYSIIVHPGADINLMHLKYFNSKSMQIDRDGNIVDNNDIGILRESAPVGYYLENDKPVTVSAQLNGFDESFVASNFDATKTLQIDPTIQWDTIPFGGSTSYDYAYDLDYDNYGNVYAYGGGPSPLQLIKLNSSGVIQWVFNDTTMTSSSNFMGDFAVDKHSEECYTVEGWNSGGGARVVKVSSTGVLIATNPGNTSFNEMWRIEYNECSSSFVIFGNGTCCPYQAAMLDTTMTTMNPVNIFGSGITTGYHDMALAAVDPLGGFAWTATTQSLVYASVLNNYLVKVPVPSLAPNDYAVPDNFAFDEIGSIFYSSSLTFNAMNGMACSQSWLYAYNGDTIKQINKATGSVVKSIQVSTTPYTWGGLDVDLYANVYAGVDNTINIYDPNLNLTSSLPTLPGAIYDLAVAPYSSQLIYACGQNFVASILLDTISSGPPPVVTITQIPSSCYACSGTAEASLNFNGVPDTINVEYLWSNGQTSRTATTLCPGVDTVTISIACGMSYKDTVTITQGESGTIGNTSDTDLCDGTAWVTPAFGIPPFTYIWSPGGETTDTIKNLCGGTYCCKFSDSTGCSDSLCITVEHPCSLAGSIYNTSDSDFCDGNAWVAVSSGVIPYTYLWSPGGQTQDSIGNLCSGTYCCIISDASGCKDTLCTNLMRKCIIYTPTLCYVTCDTISLHNVVVWQKTGYDTTKVDSFIIYRGVTSTIYNRIGAVSIHNYTSFIDTGSNPNLTSYDYKLGLSETCGVDTNLSPFQQTVLLQSSIGLGNTVNLSWDLYLGANVNYYRILRDDSGTGHWHVLDSVPGTVNVYTDLTPPLDPGLRYMLNTNWNLSCTPYLTPMRRNPHRYILVTNEESYSNITLVPITTGMQQYENPLSINVYPNPADNELYVSFKFPITGTISLCDVLGRQVYSMNIPANGNNLPVKINLDSFSSGVYFLKIESASGQRIIKKVVKI